MYLNFSSNQEEPISVIIIKGLSLENATDLKYLDDLLKDVESKVNYLTANQAQKYANKQQKKDLEVLNPMSWFLYCFFLF